MVGLIQNCLICSFNITFLYSLTCASPLPPYVTIHDKANHIALGLNQKREPKVTHGDYHFLAWIDRELIPLHKNLLLSF